MNPALKLGELVISEAQQRDAVHIAVASVVAGDHLGRGQRVRLERGVAVPCFPGEVFVAVVDPFLPFDNILPGHRVWLLFVPGSVQGLHHEWSHPSLARASDPVAEAVEALKAALRLPTTLPAPLTENEEYAAAEAARCLAEGCDP